MELFLGFFTFKKGFLAVTRGRWRIRSVIVGIMIRFMLPRIKMKRSLMKVR